MATLDRPGASIGQKARYELSRFGCSVLGSMPGRLYFQAFGLPELLRGARLLEHVGVVVLRHHHNAVGSFLDFEGATRESCLARMCQAVLSVDWHIPLSKWSCLTGRLPGPQNIPRFRVRAKRSMKAGKDFLPSDAIAVAVGSALEAQFRWHVDLVSPELEVRVHFNKDELLVSLPALVQRDGSHGCFLAHSGLHPSVSWAMAKTLNIQAGDVVLDPMCGCGALLCEAARSKPEGVIFIGCDVDRAQLTAAMENVQLLPVSDGVQLLHANSGIKGGLPISSASVDKLLVDMPFGKQFGSLEANASLYPSALAEFARVMRPGGRVVLLTSRTNQHTMRVALSYAEGSAQTSSNAHSGVWELERRRHFRLFCKTDVCIYVLRRTGTVGRTVKVDTPLETSQHMPVGLCMKPGKLDGECGLLPWEDGSPWHEQWARSRHALVPWRSQP